MGDRRVDHDHPGEALGIRAPPPPPRRDDREVEPGSALEKRLRGYLDFGVTWSAEHLQTGKTWAEIATTPPGETKDDGE